MSRLIDTQRAEVVTRPRRANTPLDKAGAGHTPRPLIWIVCVFIGHSGTRFATPGGWLCRRCGRKGRAR